MTRVVYTDLTLNFTPGSSTFPSSTQIANDITNLYRLAAEAMGVAYSASVPDTVTLFALIKSKMENHVDLLQKNNGATPDTRKPVPPLLFSRDEITMMRDAEDSTAGDWTVDSASKNEDIG
jgi:hypothetical protein